MITIEGEDKLAYGAPVEDENNVARKDERRKLYDQFDDKENGGVDGRKAGVFKELRQGPMKV